MPTAEDLTTPHEEAEEPAQRLRTRPFVPPRIYLTDGTTNDLPDPELVLVLRHGIDTSPPTGSIPTSWRRWPMGAL
jgi:hypothetical protein